MKQKTNLFLLFTITVVIIMTGCEKEMTINDQQAEIQPAIKIFAFEQDNLPGTITAGVTDENGKPARKAADKKNYFLYLSFKNTYSITPEQIFIKDQAFTILTTMDKKTPVEYINNNFPGNPQKIILVPATNDKVIEVRIKETPTQEEKTASVRELIDKNEAVIVYLWKKKEYFVTLEKIEKLETAANQ
jgi:hypothetical protein